MSGLAKYFLKPPFGFYSYIWVEVLLIQETPKALLVDFDGKRNWFPKVWIVGVKRGKNDNTAKVKISQYHWAKKFG